MNKRQFIETLEKKLQGLPQEDIDERIAFYVEIIDDKMEDGITEEKAVEQIGDVDDIAKQIIAETPFGKIAKAKWKVDRKLQPLELCLLLLGFPLWFPLLISAFAVMVSLYVVVWSLIIAFWSVVVSFIATAVGGLFAGIVFCCVGQATSGTFMFTATLVCAGLGIFAWIGCKYATKGVCIATKNMAVGLKNKMIKKDVQ